MPKTVLIVAISMLGTLTLLHADGAKLYRECAKCHGTHGEKSTFSRPIGGWHKSELVEALQGYRSGKRNLRGQGSIMRQRVADFSDAQIDAVAAYVSGLK